MGIQDLSRIVYHRKQMTNVMKISDVSHCICDDGFYYTVITRNAQGERDIQCCYAAAALA